MDRRAIVSATLRASENARAVMDVCVTTAGDATAVRAALANALGITEPEALVVLDMQIKRFSPLAVAALRSELDEIDETIRQLG